MVNEGVIGYGFGLVEPRRAVLLCKSLGGHEGHTFNAPPRPSRLPSIQGGLCSSGGGAGRSVAVVNLDLVCLQSQGESAVNTRVVNYWDCTVWCSAPEG